MSAPPAPVIDRLGRYRDLGVSGAATHIEGDSRSEWCDNAERFGAEVLARLG